MTAQTLRLESFAQNHGPTRALTEADLSQAWQEGHDQGERAAIAAGLVQLVAAIRQLGEQLSGLETARDRARAETVAAIGPVLSAIIGQLGPVLLHDRLVQEITAEIRKLAQEGAPERIILRCPPALSGFLHEHLTQAGCEADVIEDAGLQTTTVDLVAQSGRTRFEPEHLLERCETILREFLNKESSWTTFPA